MSSLEDWIIHYENGLLVLTPVMDGERIHNPFAKLNQEKIEEILQMTSAEFIPGKSEPIIEEIAAEERGNTKPLTIRKYQPTKGNIKLLILTNVLWDEQAKIVAKLEAIS